MQMLAWVKKKKKRGDIAWGHYSNIHEKLIQNIL